jgi:hypothetical protein
LQGEAYRKNQVGSAKCQPGFENVQSAERFPEEGGKVFTYNDRNMVESADEHRGTARIVHMNVNNVRPEPFMNHVTKCPQHAPQVD